MLGIRERRAHRQRDAGRDGDEPRTIPHAGMYETVNDPDRPAKRGVSDYSAGGDASSAAIWASALGICTSSGATTNTGGVVAGSVNGSWLAGWWTSSSACWPAASFGALVHAI